MSRDIRSFFVCKKPAKPAIEDNDDVIPESPDVQIKKKKKKSRNKRVICDDSDEEIFTSKKQKTQHQTKPPCTNNKGKTPEKPLKEVKAVDIFGSGPIKRTEPLVKKSKKNTEVGIHSDEEFERSLLAVDAETIASTEVVNKSEPHKIKTNKKSSNTDETPNKDKSTTKSPTKEKSKLLEEIVHVNVKDKTDTSQHKINGHENKKEEVVTPQKSKYFEHKDHRKDKRDSEMKIKKPAAKEEANSSKDTNHYKDVKGKRKLESDSSRENEKNNDFSVFLDDSVYVVEDDTDTPKTKKKKKMNSTLNESGLTDEERHERKNYCAALYQKYLNRSGPKHLGAKVIPEGTSCCLANCGFLLTGVLDSFEREEIVEAITKYGGCVKNGISKKVTHVLAGEDAGPAKMAKAQDLGIKIITEDEFIEMIKMKSQNKSATLEIKNSKTEKNIKREKSPKSSKTTNEIKDRQRSQIKKETEIKHERKRSKDSSKSPHKKKECIEPKNEIRPENDPKEIRPKTKIKSEKDTEIRLRTERKSENESKSVELIMKGSSETSVKSLPMAAPNSLMWVDKYKPQSVKQIIGQHGEASNVKKLMNWLTKWYVNRKAKLSKPSPWAKNDDGGYYKAALLSGPPGVGKTTAVGLVCKELGFDTVEFNASDTRNKTLIKEQIGELLTTTSLSAYAKGDTGKQAVTKKHVLVMDEVDGMAGNEDRGGLQELIALIKSASVPIICMCNDRNSQKMRSLVNYCYDLRFARPRVEQIKSAMMSICCKEGIKIPSSELSQKLTQLITAANQDVRQTLNLLSMWAVDPECTVERLQKDAASLHKDIKLGPWEAIRKVFSAEDHKKMSINDKSDLFFYDYSLAPLFVQENYLQVAPNCPKHEVLERISRAADSISIGDLVDARIRRNQAWSLLPVQAMYSSVIPGSVLAGHVSGQIQFPGWLGKNSRATKMQRLCQEIHAHTRLSTSGSKSSIFLDYCSHLRDAIVNPLLKERMDGIDKSLQVLEAYHLLRDDLDSLTELSLWPGQRNPMILIDSKVKAAMTRTYNKKSLALPYAPGAVKKGRARADDELDYDDDENASGDVEEDSDPEHDALIKKKKVKEEKAGSSKEKSITSKEKSSSSIKKKKK